MQSLLYRDVIDQHLIKSTSAINVGNLLNAYAFRDFRALRILKGYVINPFTPKISLVILLTDCHEILTILFQRIWYCIN